MRKRRYHLTKPLYKITTTIISHTQSICYTQAVIFRHNCKATWIFLDTQENIKLFASIRSKRNRRISLINITRTVIASRWVSLFNFCLFFFTFLASTTSHCLAFLSSSTVSYQPLFLKETKLRFFLFIFLNVKLFNNW